MSWLRRLFTSKEAERLRRSEEIGRQLWRLHQKGMRRDPVTGLPELPDGASWVLTEYGDEIWVELIDTAQGERFSWAMVANRLEASRAADEMVERRLDYFWRGAG